MFFDRRAVAKSIAVEEYVPCNTSQIGFEEDIPFINNVFCRPSLAFGRRTWCLAITEPGQIVAEAGSCTNVDKRMDVAEDESIVGNNVEAIIVAGRIAKLLRVTQCYAQFAAYLVIPSLWLL